MTLDTQEASTDDLCNFFLDFMRACSYSVGETARLEIVEDEDESEYSNLHNQVGDDEFSRSLDAEADEFINGMINEEFSEDENTPTEVQTEFNFGEKPQQ